MTEETIPPSSMSYNPKCCACNGVLDETQDLKFCPACKQSNHLSFFCNQECFKKAWRQHKNVHLKQQEINDYYYEKTYGSSVCIRYINEKEGKGMFATRNIKKDEIVLEETAFMGIVEWDKLDPNLCAHCAILCQDSTYSCQGGCSFIYCSRKCKKQAWQEYHSLECTACNEKMKDLYDLCKLNMWNSGLFAARAFIQILLAYRQSPDKFQQVLRTYKQFCTLSQEDISKQKPNWEAKKMELFKLWSTSYYLLMRHLDDGNLPPPIKELFTLEEFKRFIGKRNLNSYNGGLFILQSNMNHSCHPNIVVDDIPSQFRIRLRALCDIKQDEQLFTTYVAPFLAKEKRRMRLQEMYMFSCNCVRCHLDYHLSSELLSDIIKSVCRTK